MNHHKLGLEIINTSNEEIFRVLDMSVYSTLLSVSCPRLLITAPGFVTSASIKPELLGVGFSLILTACDLEVQTVGCDSKLESLPDGVYAVEYSLEPREFVNVKYNHLRTSKLQNRLKSIACDLENPDIYTLQEREGKLEKISKIEEVISAAKTKVDFCQDIEKGMFLFQEAQKMIEKIDCKHCNN